MATLLESVCSDSQALVDAFFESAPVALAMFDRQMCYLRVSRRWARSFTIPASALIGRCHYDVVPNIKPEWREGHRRVLNGASESCEAEMYLDPVLGARWIRWETCPWRDASGKIGGILIMVQDITEERRASLELARLQQVLQTVIDSLPQRIFWKDLSLRYAGANQAFAEDAGRATPAVLIGQSDYDMNWREHAELYRADDRAVIEHGESRLNYEEPHRLADGTEGWVRTSKIPFRDPGGAISGVIGVYEDITDQRRTQQALAASRTAALAASEAKSRFLANMSHEIRTPMNGILGMTRLAMETSVSDEQRSMLQTVESAGNALLMMLNDLLDFSKIEAGCMLLENAPFSPREVVERSYLLCKTQASAKDLHLALKLTPAVPAMVKGDSTRFGQIVLNLLSNAVKFTPVNGCILVRLDAIADGDGVELDLTVADSGIGIEPAHLEHIFDAFTQADASTTRQFGGTGLGLAIVRQLVTLMNGTIRVESQPGKGSTFFCKVRVGKCAETKVELSGGEVRRALDVLVVEDNEINVKLLTALLRKEGCQITVSSNGQEAVDVLCRQGRSFDIVLMDCHMPVMNGWDATAAIREHERRTGSRMPIVAVTANALDGDRDRCLQVGMDEYLTKPVDRSRLRKMLQWAAVCRNSDDYIPAPSLLA